MEYQARTTGVSLLSGTVGGMTATKIANDVGTVELSIFAFLSFGVVLSGIHFYEFIFGPPPAAQLLQKIDSSDKEDPEEDKEGRPDRYGPAS